MSGGNGPLWTAAIGGGAVGALVTAGLLAWAAPQWLGPKMVREALIRDPQILVAGGEALRAAQYAEAIAPIRAQLETPYSGAWKGAAKPDVTLTYFYDYACGYCRKANPDLERLLAEDKGLRVVYRELPILGPDSVAAARVSLAAAKTGKFAAFHDGLYAAGRPTPESIAATANRAGIDPRLTSDPAIEAEIGKNMQLANQLGATGTPLFVVGDQVHNAAIGYDALKAAVAAARARKA